MKISDCGQRSRSHILKTCKIAQNTNIFFIYFDRGCSYSPQYLHIICWLQQTSRNIFMTLKLRVKVRYFLKSVLWLLTKNPHSCIDGVPSYLTQWLLMKRSLNQGVLSLMWPWSQRQSRYCINPIYSSYCEFLCHFLSESVHIWQNDCLWYVVCLVWSFSSQSIIFQSSHVRMALTGLN